jgi:hypothetical protein
MPLLETGYSIRASATFAPGAKGGRVGILVSPLDGTLKHVIGASGGASPKSGHIPDGGVEISESDLAEGFRVSTLMTVNAAEFREGLFYILGGGWGRFEVQELPVDMTWSVLCSVSCGLVSDRWLQLCLIDPGS